jgi:hypothetical protein
VGPELHAAAALPRATREYRVDFSADRVELEGDLGSLKLDGDVRVRAQRYRLRSSHLELERGPRGVEVTGDADLAFCTCDDPPLKLRVSHTRLAPPTDALFGGTTLEVAGLPVFWLPFLWLRSPTRLGVTFPRVAYRGADGLFIGEGLYLPLLVNDGRVASSLTLGAFAYLVRGARLEAELDTEASSSRIAWDHVRQTALELEAHGSAALSEAAFAYRIDAMRGARASVEPSSLEIATRRSDRAFVSVSHVDDWALGFGLRADAPRAGALSDFGAAGPEFYLGAGGGLSVGLAYDTFASLRTTVSTGNHSQTQLSQRGTLSANTRVGSIELGATAAEAADFWLAELASEGGLRTGVQARGGLPLLRRFGALSHFVEPVFVARVLVEKPFGKPTTTETRQLLATGVDTSLGERRSRRALSLSVRAGALERRQAHVSSKVAFVGMLRATADTRWLGIAQSAGLLSETQTLISFSRVRVGTVDGVHALLHADGASHGSPAEARMLFDETWFDRRAPFSDSDGWSVGSELAIPWTRAFSTTGALDYDARSKAVLATWGGLGYRHGCGCLAASAFLGHRVGREGFDAWLGFDLAP